MTSSWMGRSVMVAVMGMLGFALVLLVPVSGARAQSRNSKAASTQGPVSFAYDWGGSNEVVTIYKVPAGHHLVLTDIAGYWWDEGPAQRFMIYQDVELKGSFLASSRGRKGENGYMPFHSSYHFGQSGLVFEPGSEVRVIPSTTYLSITLAGQLIAD